MSESGRGTNKAVGYPDSILSVPFQDARLYPHNRRIALAILTETDALSDLRD
jgi:hypothetical protein